LEVEGLAEVDLTEVFKKNLPQIKGL